MVKRVNNLTYEVLQNEIENDVPSTMLPALLKVTIKTCLKKEVFKSKLSLLEFVVKILQLES